MAKARKPKPKARAKKAARKPAPKPLHAKRFPNESRAYRSKRDALLKEEINLRRAVERVAALRRKLPQGGDVREDYIFEEQAADRSIRRVNLSELFGGKNSLIIYGFMFGPDMNHACPSCSSIIDALDKEARHINQQASIVAVAKSPVERIEELRRERGWNGIRFLSWGNNSYGQDYFAEDEQGRQRPMLNVFQRANGKTRHFYATELDFVPSDKGQNPRHVDLIWPLWNALDYTPEGRDPEWQPKLSYAE